MSTHHRVQMVVTLFVLAAVDVSLQCYAGDVSVERLRVEGVKICEVGDLRLLCDGASRTEKRLWVVSPEGTGYLMQVFGQTPERPMNGALRRIDIGKGTCENTTRELNWPAVAAAIANWETIDESAVAPQEDKRIQLLVEDCWDAKYSTVSYPADGRCDEDLSLEAARRVSGFVIWLEHGRAKDP